MEGENKFFHARHRGLDVIVAQNYQEDTNPFGNIYICDSFGWGRSLVHGYDFTRTRWNNTWPLPHCTFV